MWRRGDPKAVSAVIQARQGAGGLPSSGKDLREAAVALLSAKIAAMPAVWAAVRDLFERRGVVSSKASKKGGQSGGPGGKGAGGRGGLGALASYDGFGPASLRRLQPHQTMALARGKERGLLTVAVALPEAENGGLQGAVNRECCRALPWFTRGVCGRDAAGLMTEGIADALARSLKRRAAGAAWRERVATAQRRAIEVFGDNLKVRLLLEL